jgi:hypothetical protein
MAGEGSSSQATIVFVGVLSALLVIPQVSKVAGGILASSAVVGLVIGFASQRTIGNAVAGTIVRPSGADPSVHARSAALGYVINPPITLYYFAYYRDPSAAGPCGSSLATFNSTQAGAVLWQ